MTIADFRSSEPRTTHMRTVLADPIVQDALMAACDHFRPTEVPLACDAVVSVRQHSRGSGAAEFLQVLLTTADPVPPVIPEPPRTYGTEYSTDQLESSSP